MRSWLNWRTAVGSVVLSLVLAYGLFAVTGRSFSLSGLDLFFAVTTAVSLALNLWQLFRDRYKYAPLKDLLIGLLNDLKARGLRVHERQLMVDSPIGMQLPLEAVRFGFWDFTRETLHGLEQLREHVVAAIQVIDPAASTQQIFRAAEFGLNEQEKRLKEEGMERFIERTREAEEAQAAEVTRRRKEAARVQARAAFEGESGGGEAEAAPSDEAP